MVLNCGNNGALKTLCGNCCWCNMAFTTLWNIYSFDSAWKKANCQCNCGGWNINWQPIRKYPFHQMSYSWRHLIQLFVCRFKTSSNLNWIHTQVSLTIVFTIVNCFSLMLLTYTQYKIHRIEDGPQYHSTFVKTSLFSWVRSLVSRKWATQLIPVSKEKALAQDLEGDLMFGVVVGLLVGMLVDLMAWMLVNARRDHGHWYRWPSDATESHVWMFWEALHYRCTPNVTHTLWSDGNNGKD